MFISLLIFACIWIFMCGNVWHVHCVNQLLITSTCSFQAHKCQIINDNRWFNHLNISLISCLIITWSLSFLFKSKPFIILMQYKYLEMLCSTIRSIFDFGDFFPNIIMNVWLDEIDKIAAWIWCIVEWVVEGGLNVKSSYFFTV